MRKISLRSEGLSEVFETLGLEEVKEEVDDKNEVEDVEDAC